MKTYVNQISGIDDAIVSLYMSKRSWNRDMEMEIRKICRNVLNYNGSLKENAESIDGYEQFQNWMDTLTRWGTHHITLLRFIDFSITVEGLHRAGQDDWDAHAMRFNNRIIRNSTRIKGSNFEYEVSSWYEDKILPTDIALKELKIELPESIEHNGKIYVKGTNGYIVKGCENMPDVKRGLYMLSIPSSFIFKVNLTEWAHVYKERNASGSANPEVKACCESIADQLEQFHSQFNRKLFQDVRN